MCVTSITTFTQDQCNDYHVTGISYNPEGEIQGQQAKNLAMKSIMKVSSLCNESTLYYDAGKDQFCIMGEPTEAALRVLVEKYGIPEIEVFF